MWEGETLLSHFETMNVLLSNKYLSATEFNAMVPWQLSVLLSLVKRDQEERAAQEAKTAGKEYW